MRLVQGVFCYRCVTVPGTVTQLGLPQYGGFGIVFVQIPYALKIPVDKGGQAHQVHTGDGRAFPGVREVAGFHIIKAVDNASVGSEPANQPPERSVSVDTSDSVAVEYIAIVVAHQAAGSISAGNIHFGVGIADSRASEILANQPPDGSSSGRETAEDIAGLDNMRTRHNVRVGACDSANVLITVDPVVSSTRSDSSGIMPDDAADVLPACHMGVACAIRDASEVGANKGANLCLVIRGDAARDPEIPQGGRAGGAAEKAGFVCGGRDVAGHRVIVSVERTCKGGGYPVLSGQSDVVRQTIMTGEGRHDVQT